MSTDKWPETLTDMQTERGYLLHRITNLKKVWRKPPVTETVNTMTMRTAAAC